LKSSRENVFIRDKSQNVTNLLIHSKSILSNVIR